jgi:Outer membrane protein beta-barrel domain
MKLLTAALAAFLLYGTVNAQVKIAIKAGPTFSTAKVSLNGVKQASSFKPGASLGVQCDVPFDGALHFSPYIAYNTLGAKTNYKLTGANTQTTLHYLQLAPGVSFHFNVAKTNVFVFGFSPVLGLTKFGRQKTTIAGVTTKEKIKFGYEGIGWFDLGLAGSVGYHFKKMFVEVNYYDGLTNINNNEQFDGINIRNKMLNLNVGYYLR